MMKYLAIGLFFAFGITTARAQITLDTAQWRLVSGASELTGITNMKWSSNDTGFFFGSDVNLTRTVDSGNNFSVLSFPNPVDTIHLDTNGHPYVVYNHHSAIQSVADMTWPTQNTGFVVGSTGSDNYGHTPLPTVLVTQDGGTTWSQYYPTNNDTVITRADTTINKNVNPPDTTITPADTVINPELWNNVYFPTPSVGYASTMLVDGSKDFITKTTDGGKTWTNLYHSDSLTFGKLYFIDASNGMLFASGNTDHIGYTIDGGTTFRFVSVGTDSLTHFLHWNDDHSWLVGSDSIYRSVDSGKHWVSVVPYDASAQAATIAAFHDSVGFVFRANAPVVLHSMDYGATWKSDRLPKVGADTILPLAASMPSSTEAYLLGQLQQTNNVLMKIAFPPAPQQNNGSVAMAPSEDGQFSAAMQGNAILFTANSAARPRTIDILDVLGRVCTSISLPPGATTSQLSSGLLRQGTYFARLGSAMVKFAVWQ
ncbi:MAG TPA: hypothetical protein VFH95_02840 [Candidatus Kapabacteria bacterium]|nr:hypothetical protein [Candidatus Kapabacteria bacterium]